MKTVLFVFTSIETVVIVALMLAMAHFYEDGRDARKQLANEKEALAELTEKHKQTLAGIERFTDDLAKRAIDTAEERIYLEGRISDLQKQNDQLKEENTRLWERLNKESY